MTVDMFHQPDQFQLFCPSCQVDLTLVKHQHGSVRPPQNGDHTVCFGCLSFLCYVEPEPGQLRLDLIKQEVFEALPEKHQAALMQVKGELEHAKEEGKSQPTRFETALALEVTALKARVAVLEARLGAVPAHKCAICLEADCVCYEVTEDDDTGGDEFGDQGEDA